MIFWENQKIIRALYTQCTKPVCNRFGLTQMEYDIMMFLHNHPQYDTAADLVKTRMLTKSHVSAALKALEDKRYIERSHRNGNRKSVHLKITDAAEAAVIAGENAQKNFAGKLFKGFSDAEFAQCRALFSRMCENARNGIQLEV